MKKMMMACLLAVVLTGCKTVERTEYRDRWHTDTCFVNRWQRDSIVVRDSVMVTERTKGDTVEVEKTRWRTEYRDRWQTDTVYIAKADTIQVTEQVVMAEKEKSLTERTWDVLKMGCVLMVLLWVMNRARKWGDE